MINYKYDSEFNRDFTIEDTEKEKLVINNSHGNISIIEDDVENIEVQAEILIKHNDEDYAKYVKDNIINVNTSKEKSIEIVSESDIFLNEWKKVKNIRVNYSIKIPEGLEVNIRNGFGNITAENITKTVSITNRHGNVLTRRLSGNLFIKNSYGKVNIENVDGNVDVESNHGDVFASKIEGKVNINNTYGMVKVDNIRNDTKIENIHNSVTATNIEGGLFVNTRHGKIDIQNVKGNAEVNGSYKSISIDRIKGNVIARNIHGDIIVNESNKKIELITKHGDIRVGSKNIFSDDVRLQNEYGDIKLIVPDEQQGIFEVYNKYGKIHHELDFNVIKDVNELMINEKIGESENKFYLKTKNGDIEINTN